MPDDNGNINRWIEVGKWRGETVRAIKDLNVEVKQNREDNEKDHKEIMKKLNEIQSRLNKSSRKTAELAGFISGLVVVLGYIIPTLLT